MRGILLPSYFPPFADFAENTVCMELSIAAFISPPRTVHVFGATVAGKTRFHTPN